MRLFLAPALRHMCPCHATTHPPLPPLPPFPTATAPADRHGYDPFVLELDLKPFGAHQPKISLQARGWRTLGSHEERLPRSKCLGLLCCRAVQWGVAREGGLQAGRAAASRRTSALVQPPLQSHIGNGVSFLNKTLSAKLFSPNANAEGRWVLLADTGDGTDQASEVVALPQPGVPPPCARKLLPAASPPAVPLNTTEQHSHNQT